MTNFPFRLDRLFDKLFSDSNIRFFQIGIVVIAILGLLTHVGLIYLSDLFNQEYHWMEVIGTNYLSAIYTPFSFILFYEVFLLVISIAESTTSFIGRQYQIISLIVIRDTFKDISKFGGFEVSENNRQAFIDVLLDMGGGVALFLMVTVFYHLRGTLKDQRIGGLSSKELKSFVSFKKHLALVLSVVLFALAAVSLGGWIQDAAAVVWSGKTPSLDVDRIFYVDMFTIMIFSDVLILLTSMAFIREYRLVIRNAGFVISTIIIRFALSISKPYDVELAILGSVFGTLVLAVYSYSLRVSYKKGPNEFDEIA